MKREIITPDGKRRVVDMTAQEIAAHQKPIPPPPPDMEARLAALETEVATLRKARV